MDLPKVAITRRQVILTLVTFLLSLVTIWIMRRYADRVLVGDPAVYRERIVEVLDKGWPYLDVTFEHLPVMIVPMLLAWLLGGAQSQSHYVIVFGFLMAATLAATTFMTGMVGRRVGAPKADIRWVVMILPLLPLITFRNDPVAVLLAVGGMALLSKDSSTWVAFGAAGGLAKIWPAVLGWLAWSKKKWSAVLVALAGLIGLLISVSPGFADRRNAVGIHTETVLGGVIGLWRSARSEPVEVILTTAAYLDVPTWLSVVNALLGLLLFGFGLVAVQRVEDLRSQIVRLGTVVGGVILTSQLFSLQYVLWVVPFLALSQRRLALVVGFALTIPTIWLGWTWSVEYLETPAFYWIVSSRNLVFIGTVGWLALERPRNES